MRVFVCASARWTDEAAIEAELDALPEGETTILQAKPDRQDNLAVAIAREYGMPVEDFTPHALDATYHGRRVGRICMWRALDTTPDLVLAFRLDRSSGISEIIREARRRAIAIKVIDQQRI